MQNYPYLPEGREIKYVAETDLFISEAKRIRKEFSTDEGHPTGAVVVLGDEIIGRGANQSALKNKKLIDLHKKGVCVRRFLKIPSGQKYWMCPGCSKNKHHAEARAVKDALKNGKSPKGADLYLYGHWWCCKPCWDEMIAAGIKNVYLVEGATEQFKR
jgi:deoxycytidylate deaminase